MPTTTKARPVENITRVTVAFPFSTIKTTGAEGADAVEELATLVAALATELDARDGNQVTADLAVRCQELAERIATD